MERKLPLTFVVIVFSTILVSSGCQKKTVATDPNSQSKSELRDNTRPLQAADLVGYNGTKLRSSMDRIKEANAKHNREMEKMVESGSDH
jgi:PBP1b-binding outer membrane lipoprotein LpoB